MKPLPRAVRSVLIAVALAAPILVPATTAHAQAGCLVADYEASVWSSGASNGGFTAAITITNDCDGPVDGWALSLTLPPGHGFSHGWSAAWASTGGQLTAGHLSWNRVRQPGTSLTIGFVGSWSGTYRDPLACEINGGACDGGPGTNEPPVVALTNPASSFAGFVSPCPFRFAASASDPDGAVDRVEFYVNNVLLGTDRTAPYSLPVTFGALPPPRPGTFDWVAFARAFDNGAPARSTDSAPRTFQVAIGDPIPESIFACASSLALPAGTAESVMFGLFSSVVNQVTLTVNGDPRITVTPTTVTRSGNAIVATVTAAPGSTGATATITATGGTLNPVSMAVTVT